RRDAAARRGAQRIAVLCVASAVNQESIELTLQQALPSKKFLPVNNTGLPPGYARFQRAGLELAPLGINEARAARLKRAYPGVPRRQPRVIDRKKNFFRVSRLPAVLHMSK